MVGIKRRAGLCFGALVMVTAAACGSGSSDDAKGEGDLVTIKLQTNYVPAPVDSYLYYGRAKGLFEDAGIKLEFVPGASSQQTVNSVLAGTADVGRVADTAVMQNAAKGQVATSIGMVWNRGGMGVILLETKQRRGSRRSRARRSSTPAEGPGRC